MNSVDRDRDRANVHWRRRGSRAGQGKMLLVTGMHYRLESSTSSVGQTGG